MIPVLYQDEHLLVVHKPIGMLVHRGMGAQADEAFLLQTVRDQVGAWLYPVHRLDRPTCGLVMFGLSSDVARILQEQWQEGRVGKSYQAIVRGWMPEAEGIHDEPLDSPDNGALQDAQTRWKVLERCTLPLPLGKHSSVRFSLLELTPFTGRWHQLRRHLARLHHPIAGDTTHGCRHINHLLQEKLGWWRLFLWAHRLHLEHPVTGEILELHDEPERGLSPWWEILRRMEVPCPSV